MTPIRLTILSMILLLTTSCQIVRPTSTARSKTAFGYVPSIAQTGAARIEPYRSAGVKGSGAKGDQRTSGLATWLAAPRGFISSPITGLGD